MVTCWALWLIDRVSLRERFMEKALQAEAECACRGPLGEALPPPPRLAAPADPGRSRAPVWGRVEARPVRVPAGWGWGMLRPWLSSGSCLCPHLPHTAPLERKRAGGLRPDGGWARGTCPCARVRVCLRVCVCARVCARVCACARVVRAGAAQPPEALLAQHTPCPGDHLPGVTCWVSCPQSTGDKGILPAEVMVLGVDPD